MAVRSILEILILLLGLTRVITMSENNNSCEYDLTVVAERKNALDSSFEVEQVVLTYIISDTQSDCIMDVDEIYTHLTKRVTVNKTNLYSTINFQCVDNSDIHFLSLGSSGKFDKLHISIYLSLTMCSVYVDELANFQKYGYIHSISTTNGLYINSGASCITIKNIRKLSSSLVCTENYKNETNLRKSFFWEVCDPLDQLIELNLQGCREDMYNMNTSFMQSKFPKLQRLGLKYTNLTLSEMTFPWTNESFNISDFDSIKPITFYTESDEYGNHSIKRMITIYDCIVNFSNDVTLFGHISKIFIKKNKMPKLSYTIFKNVRDLIVLDLSNNEIKEVDKHAFIMQTKLEILILANNNLTTLPLDVFDNLSNLFTLDLSSNRITKVEQRYFKYLTKLENLNLEQNSIMTLPYDFLESQINSLQRVFLSENPLETFPLNVLYAPKILFVGLRHCHFNSSGFKSLLNNSRLIELDDRPTQVYPLRTVEKVHSQKPILDWSQNNITEISFKHGNKLDILKFWSIIKKLEINLTDNPIDCSCLSREVNGKSIDWKCQYPLELRGRYMATIKPEKIYCPIYGHSCPDKCACFKRNHTNKLIIDCRDINMTSLPSVMPVGSLELLFSNTNLHKLLPMDYMENVTTLDVSYNKINRITTTLAKALDNVSILKLDHNYLTHLPERFATMNMTKVTLLGNPFICDCKMKWMKSWLLIRTNPVEQWNKIGCKYNTSSFGKLTVLNDSVFVCTPKLLLREHHILSSVITGGVLFVLVCILLLITFQRFTIKVLLFLYCGFHPFDKPSQNHSNTRYDAFILYSYMDREFIQNNLVDKMKSKGYKVANFYNNMIVGFSFLQNVEIFIERSKRIIFCWTKDMLENDLIISAWNMAYEKAVTNGLDLLILVVDSDVDKRLCTYGNLQRYLKSGRYIKKTIQIHVCKR